MKTSELNGKQERPPMECFAMPAYDFRRFGCGCPKRPSWLLINLLLILCFAGCGGSNSPADSNRPPEISAAEPTQSNKMVRAATSDVVAESSPGDTTATADSEKTGSVNESTRPAVDSGRDPVEPHSKEISDVSVTRDSAVSIKEPPKPTAEQLSAWNLTDHPVLKLLDCYDDYGRALIDCLAVSGDGSLFVAGGSKLLVWKTGQSEPSVDLIAEYNEEQVQRPIRSVAISDDGMLLAAGDARGTLRVWSLAELREVLHVPAHESRLVEMAFSVDSKTLATTSYSGEVRLWNTSTGEAIQKWKASSVEIAALVFVKDDQLVVCGSETSIWDTSTGKKVESLTTERVISPAATLSRDRKLLAYVDSDSKTYFWNLTTSKKSTTILDENAPHLLDFSIDGTRLATLDRDSNIRIRDIQSGQTIQVIDADGERTMGLKWLTKEALIAASEGGRIRIWGTNEAAEAMGIKPIELPAVPHPVPPSTTPLSSAQLQQAIDLRSLPRLPGGTNQWSEFGMVSYVVMVQQTEAEAFYRHVLATKGWTELPPAQPTVPGLAFERDGCRVNVSFQNATVPENPGKLQITLQFAGNFDVRSLPRISPIESPTAWNSFSFVSYETRVDLAELEIALLKKYHAAGWTPYSRLAASSLEDPLTRTMTFLQKGSALTVFVRHPAESADKLAVQTIATVTTKSLPIPPDAGWIEFDASTNLKMVANSKMELSQTVEFFDHEMPAEGWMARQAGRLIKDGKAWLPYIRGQQDALIRLVPLEGGGTRILVGDAEQTSWQIESTPSKQTESVQPKIEAADIVLPQESTNIHYDLDEKQIEFRVADSTPMKLAASFIEQMDKLDWKKQEAGVSSDEYVLVTVAKNKAEIQLRARAEITNVKAMISGDGLNWTKPIPSAAVRISYGSWMRRLRKPSSLEYLDEFAAQMQKIPASSPVKQ